MVSYYLPPLDRIGAGYMQHYLANAYVRAGNSVTMFSPVTDKSEDALYDLVTIPIQGRNRFFRFAWKLRRQAFTDFDMLHTGSEAFFLFGQKRPYHITTYHGSCLAEAIHSRRLQDRIRMLVMALAETGQCLLSDRNVCVSHNTRRYIPLAREVIWNGVDQTCFQPGLPKSTAPSILFVGELDSRKRGRALLEAFEREVRQFVPNAELWIVRDTTAIESPGVLSFGRVSLAKLIELYQTAWVFCLPSSYEGFGVPYIEAMSSGTPVVATPNAGACEVLEEGKFGRIVPLPELGKVLIEVLENSNERKRLTELGLRRAKDFDWPTIVERYLETVRAD